MTQSGQHERWPHLPPAPWRFVGHQTRTYQACPGAPVQVGDSCDHCGTGIRECFDFVGADGRTFTVGSTCVNKMIAEHKATASLSAAQRVARAAKRESDAVARAKRAARKHAEAAVRINAAKALLPTVRDALASKPHPRGFVDRQTGLAMTLLDWAEWMLCNAGDAGRLEVAAVIERTNAELSKPEQDTIPGLSKYGL